MSAMKFLKAAVGAVVLTSALAVPSLAQAATGVKIDVPSSVTPGISSAVTLGLPNGVAAVEGRVLVDASAAELIGVAPGRGGSALAPTETSGGFAFGVYGMKPSGTKNDLSLVLMPHVAGQLQIRVVIDAAANAAGKRLGLTDQTAIGNLQVGNGSRFSSAPSTTSRGKPALGEKSVRGTFGRSTITGDDLDVTRAAWYTARAGTSSCSTSTTVDGDANGDGCVDIVDLQLINASLGTRVTSTTNVHARAAFDASSVSSSGSAGTSGFAMAAVLAGKTFTVTSTADTPDAVNGDGICADSNGNCTLRAALTESNWNAGHNTINFNLAGTAPVVIQLGNSTMSQLGSTSSSVTIDGYSQPGSSVNTAASGTNAVPGVVLRGNGRSATQWLLYGARPDNTVRGLVFANAYRGIFLDTPNASNNLIVGNWIGFNGNGSLSALGHAGVYLNNGAHDNIIGTPALADRNVVGNQDKALYSYGPGAGHNIFQNNVVCISPTGARASCATGVDFDFGAKNNIVGGTNAGEQNVIGPTDLNGIEISHGWDPSTNHVSTPEYQNNYNQIIGNWVGFRADGSYDASYRSAQKPPSADNGQALHAYDGSNFNTFQGNYVGAAYDGVTIASSNSTGNVVTGNIIGRSPLGQPAPLQRYGIYLANNTHANTIQANVIDNVGAGGIELIDFNILYIRISQNLVFSASGPAIYLAPDPSNPSTGANDLLAAPVITAAGTAAVAGTGIAGATVEVFQASRDAGAAGLPIAYLGSTTVKSDGQWSVPVNLQVGQRVTATQIVPNGDTSSLATNVVVDVAPAPVADFTSSQEDSSLKVDFVDASGGQPTAWSWDFGDGQSSNERNPTHEYASAGDYTVTLTASNTSGGDSETKSIHVDPVASGTTIAADSFNRNQNSGWGSADTGGVYTLDGNLPDFNVANGAGSIQVPSANGNKAAYLNGASASDVDMKVRITAGKAPAGGSFFAFAEARHNGNNTYRGKLVLRTDGSVAVQASVVINGTETGLGAQVPVSGLTFTPFSYIWLRVQVTGSNPTTIKVKAWADGQSEPNAWQFSATDGRAAVQVAGGVGLRAYLHSAVTNAPVTFFFDDLTVTAAAPPTPGPVAQDGFARTVSNGWGSADDGGPYTLLGNAANYSVSSGAGKMQIAAGLTRAAILDGSYGTNVDIIFRVATDKVAAVGTAYAYGVARRNTNNEYRPRLILKPDGTVAVSVSVVVSGKEAGLGQQTVAGLTQTAGSYIWVHAQVTGTSPTTIKIRAWADGTTEPAAWQLTVTDSSAALQGAGAVGLMAYLSSNSTANPTTFSFDDYSVVTAP